ncbi:MULTISPECIES: exosortase A [unclassified Sphingomonas]|uniref:exosortase A n=1 Tax=unclassified Sphingomonas TaxID=196159 RepID=UPI000E767766|nr:MULTISPECIES: exosortase A [unclassified Sphingomonas]RKE50082.1 exosortase A [Sphingomonas sp. PP-CC-1A-547]TCM08415.1 exosortase A [Sphingomonas sp. PP-CC-3G-468]
MMAWRRHGIGLAVVAVLILLAFRSDVVDLAHIWWTSTTFGHCLFIGPVIAWLVWQRRAELAQLTPIGWWPGLALVAIGGFGWLMGDAASVGFARQLGLVMMLQGAVVTILGPKVARGLHFPLAYAFFLVPFGEGLEPPLQTVTVAIVMPLLHLVGVPAAVDGVLIHAGRYYFEVAEACSGAKFVIAMVAFGVLVANLCFVSWKRRAVFLVVSVVVPVIANGFRAFGTIWAADLTSVEAATGIDHIVYGWVFFALVMAGVLAIGWRWFDRAPDDLAFDPAKLQVTPRQRTDLAIATALVLATVAAFPAWSAAVASRVQPLPAHIDLPEIAGWHRVPVSTRAPWTPYYPGADHYLFGRYADAAGAQVDMSIGVFGSQHESKELIAYGTGVLREEDRWVRVADLPDIEGGSVMRITAPGPVERIVATWYRVGNTTTQDDTLVKIETMKARLLGGPQRAVAIHLSVEGADPRPIARFLAALGPIAPVADYAAGMR